MKNLSQTQKSFTKPDDISELYYLKTKSGCYHYTYDQDDIRSVNVLADTVYGHAKGLFIHVTSEKVCAIFSNDEKQNTCKEILDSSIEDEQIYGFVKNILKFSALSMESKDVYYLIEDTQENKEHIVQNLFERLEKESIAHFKDVEKVQEGRKALKNLELLQNNTSRYITFMYAVIPIIIAFFASHYLSGEMVEQRYDEHYNQINQIDSTKEDTRKQAESIKKEFDKYKYLTTKEDIDAYIQMQLQNRKLNMKR